MNKLNYLILQGTNIFIPLHSQNDNKANENKQQLIKTKNMKTNYQIIRELDGKKEIVHTETNKRKIESFFNGLRKNFIKGGIWVKDIRQGYFLLPALDAEYWICKA